MKHVLNPQNSLYGLFYVYTSQMENMNVELLWEMTPYLMNIKEITSIILLVQNSGFFLMIIFLLLYIATLYLKVVDPILGRYN